MKKVEAIVRPEKLADVRRNLEEKGYSGLMITEVQGHGRQKGIEQQWRGEKYRIDIFTKLKLELVTEDDSADRIVLAIAEAARTGEIGDGKIFVTPVEDALRIRTGDRGKEAL